MARTPSSLNDIPIDAQQSLIKTYCANTEAHRVIETGIEFNKVEYAYDCCNRLSTVTYYYDCTAEVTNITPIADCCGSLCGKTWIIYSKGDVKQYRFIYNVSCGATIPANTATMKHISVGIVANDAIPVIALATKQAMEADACFSADFCVTQASNLLTITNAKKGEATNAADVDTGFTVATATNGTRSTVEIVTYEYDTDGRLKCITTNTGEHLFDLNELQNQRMRLEGTDGYTAGITKYNELQTVFSPREESLLTDLHDQLRLVVLQLSLLTDEHLTKKDLEDEL